MKLGSLFDGIGGFALAAANNGITPVWASEIEPVCISVTKRHFPEMKHLGDIRNIDGAEIEPVDIITFGSPCQDLSIAGKRAGLKGSNSSLFLEAVRIIKEMRGRHGKPDFIVWENVPGAFSSNKGRDFKTVVEETAKIAEAGVSIPKPGGGWLAAGAVMGNGYSIAWRVLDCQYWGIPQRRKRIFLVGDFRGKSAPEILFKPGGLQGDIEEGGKAGEGTACGTERGFRAAGFRGRAGAESDISYGEELACTLNAGNEDHVVQYAVDLGHSWHRIQMNPEKAVTLRGGGKGKTGTYCFQSFGEYKESEKSKSLLACDDVTTGDLIKDCYKVRRLTPLEAERLMGFPDGWTEYDMGGKPLSDTARYKGLGNSVAVPCVGFILGRIKEAA